MTRKIVPQATRISKTNLGGSGPVLDPGSSIWGTKSSSDPVHLCLKGFLLRAAVMDCSRIYSRLKVTMDMESMCERGHHGRAIPNNLKHAFTWNLLIPQVSSTRIALMPHGFHLVSSSLRITQTSSHLGSLYFRPYARHRVTSRSHVAPGPSTPSSRGPHMCRTMSLGSWKILSRL